MNYKYISKSKKNTSFFDATIIVLSCMFIFVSSLRGVSLVQYSIFLFVFILIKYLIKKIQTNNFDLTIQSIFLIIYVCSCFISILYSYSKRLSFEFCVLILICTLLFYYFSQKQKWIPFFEKVLITLALINITITILSSLDFALFYKLFKPLITKETMQFAISAKQSNEFSGIMGQTGTNAFSIVPLALIAFSRIRNKKKLFLSYSYLFLTLWALFLTNKRGALLWGLCSITFIFLCKEWKINKKISLTIIKGTILGSFIYFIINIFYKYSSIAQNVLQRFTIQNNNDITSGRTELSREALQHIFEHPIGIGINAYSALYGENVHNDFLQLIAEIGLLGMIFFFAFYLCILWKGIKKYFQNNSCNDYYMEVFLSLAIYQLLSCFTSFPLHNYGFSIYVFITLAAIQNMIFQRKENQSI